MVNKETIENTEARILESAREVFLKKGMSGARMQDIANAAGINKALLHYYFRSKEKLFERIFQEAARELFPQLDAIFNSEASIFEKIERFCVVYIDIVKQNPFLPMFILNEIHQDEQGFFENYWNKGRQPRPQKFLKELEVAVQRGEIRKVPPIQLLMHLISMTLFPFVARPLLQKTMGIPTEKFIQLMEDRKIEIPQFIISAIKL